MQSQKSENRKVKNRKIAKSKNRKNAKSKIGKSQSQKSRKSQSQKPKTHVDNSQLMNKKQIKIIM